MMSNHRIAKWMVMFLSLPAFAQFTQKHTFTEPNATGDPGDAQAIQWLFNTDTRNTNPNFSDVNGMELILNQFGGQNDVDGAGKKTVQVLSLTGNYSGAGQRFLQGNYLNCYGMGDCFVSGDQVTSAAGLSSNGDEGTAFRTMNLSQLGNVVKATVSEVPMQSRCNTTLDRPVSRSLKAQSVTVASTAGCAAGDWVTLDRGKIYRTDGSIEAVQLLAVGSGTVRAIIKHDHKRGAAVTPATVLTLSSTAQMGQLRYLVNETRSGYSAGSISGISSRNSISGKGATWSSGMVGGDTTLPGCISFTADNYTKSPFSASAPLVAWYGIDSVTSGTALSIAHKAAPGPASYSGNATKGGSYIVRPCARILDFASDPSSLGNTVILESNTFTWRVGDTVENAISVDADVSGELMRVSWYMPGAQYRALYTAVNYGEQAFMAGFSVQQGSQRNSMFTNGLLIQANTQNGIAITGTTDNAAINITGAGAIKWRGAPYIGPNLRNLQNAELDLGMAPAGSNYGGALRLGAGASYYFNMTYEGNLVLQGTRSIPPMFQMKNASNKITWQVPSNGIPQAPGLAAPSGTNFLCVDATGNFASSPVACNTKVVSPPASSSAACAIGQTADDTNFHYVCVATNRWKRAALSTW